MKNKFSIFVGIIVIMTITLACGSTSEVQVNEPSTNNSETQNTSAPSEPTTAPVGSARSNPAPIGSEILVDDMNFTVNSIVRPANDLVSAGNTFNSEADAGKEYLFVEIQLECTKSSDEKCSFNTYNFKVLGSNGVLTDVEMFISGVDGLIESTEFFGESSISGYLPFVVDVDDNDILLVFDPLFGSNDFYMSLSDQ